MSLLNDALRKKKSELRPLGQAPRAGRRPHGSYFRLKRRWIAVLCCLMLAAAAGAAWWFGSELESGSGLAVVDAPQTRQSVLPNDMSGKPATSDAPSLQAAGQQASLELSAATAAKPAGPLPGSRSPHAPAEAQLSSRQPKNSAAPAKPRAARAEKVDATQSVTTSKTVRGRPAREASRPAARPDKTTDHQQIDRLFHKARQYHRRNNLEQAIALYQEVLKADAGFRQARINLVAAYLQTKAYAKAYPTAVDLYRQQPDNQEIILNLSIAEIGLGRFQEAIFLLDKAAGRPDAALFEIAFHKAVAYSRLNRLREAMRWYRQAEILRPEDPELLFNLAVAYDQQEQYQTAVGYYRRYMQCKADLDPLQTEKIRRRVRLLQTYGAQEKFEE